MEIALFVDGIKGVEESLAHFFKPEEIEGVFCNDCEENTLAYKGPLVTKLPPVMTFNLTRIKYDLATWDRIKINDKFEYPLELDMSKYLD